MNYVLQCTPSGSSNIRTVLPGDRAPEMIPSCYNKQDVMRDMQVGWKRKALPDPSSALPRVGNGQTARTSRNRQQSSITLVIVTRFLPLFTTPLVLIIIIIISFYPPFLFQSKYLP